MRKKIITSSNFYQLGFLSLAAQRATSSSTVNLQCCVNLRCIAKWLSYTYTHTHTHIYALFHYKNSFLIQCLNRPRLKENFHVWFRVETAIRRRERSRRKDNGPLEAGLGKLRNNHQQVLSGLEPHLLLFALSFFSLGYFFMWTIFKVLNLLHTASVFFFFFFAEWAAGS